MRVAVMGTGGLGGCIGGLMAHAGEDVALIARGANLEAIRANGLTVKSLDHGEFNVRLTVTDNPAELDPVDLVLFCVKTYDTDGAIELIRPIVGDNTIVMSVQNGVDNANKIGNALGHEHVIGAISLINAHLESPGVVAQHLSIGMEIGELDGSSSQRTEELGKAFERAGIPCTVRPDILTSIWEKFGIFVAGVAVETALRLPMGPMRECPETRELIIGMLEEAVEVAKATGVQLKDSYIDDMMDLVDNKAPANHKGSMLVDIEAGKRIEVEGINGALVRLGKENGVPTPLNFAVYALLKPYAEGPPELPA